MLQSGQVCKVWTPLDCSESRQLLHCVLVLITYIYQFIKTKAQCSSCLGPESRPCTVS